MLKTVMTMASIALVASVSLGSAHAKQICTMVYAPVCAVKSGVEETYTNVACARAAGAKVVLNDRCENREKKQATYCLAGFKPVCATKGAQDLTYSNACRALADGAFIKSQGKCGSDK